jgi:hypothetical protein
MAVFPSPVCVPFYGGRDSNVTAHPTAEWTLQQSREAIPSDHSCRFLIRDRDSIFSKDVDEQLKAFGLRLLRTPARALPGERLL